MSIFKKSRHLGFDAFIGIWSMLDLQFEWPDNTFNCVSDSLVTTEPPACGTVSLLCIILYHVQNKQISYCNFFSTDVQGIGSSPRGNGLCSMVYGLWSTDLTHSNKTSPTKHIN